MDRRLGYPVIALLLVVAVAALLLLAGVPQPWVADPATGDGVDVSIDGSGEVGPAYLISNEVVAPVDRGGAADRSYLWADTDATTLSLQTFRVSANLTTADEAVIGQMAVDLTARYGSDPGAGDVAFDSGILSLANASGDAGEMEAYETVLVVKDQDASRLAEVDEPLTVIFTAASEVEGLVPAENLFIDLESQSFGITNLGTSTPTNWSYVDAETGAQTGNLLFSPTTLTLAPEGSPGTFLAYQGNLQVNLTNADYIDLDSIQVFAGATNAFVLDDLVISALNFRAGDDLILLRAGAEPLAQTPLPTGSDDGSDVLGGSISFEGGSQLVAYPEDGAETIYDLEGWTIAGSEAGRILVADDALSDPSFTYATVAGPDTGEAFILSGQVIAPASPAQIDALVSGDTALAGAGVADAAPEESASGPLPWVGSWLALAMIFLLAVGLAVFVFTRLQSSQALDGKRAEIAAYIQQHPGVSVADLRRQFAMSSSSAAHHLDVLEKYQNVISFKAGKSRRYFANFNGYQRLASSNYKAILSALHNPSSSDFVRFLDKLGPMNQKDLAEVMGVHPSTVHWHGVRLSDAGLVQKEPQGKEVLYTLIDPTLARHALELVAN